MLRRLSRKSSSDSKNVLPKFLEFIDSSIWALPIATFIEHRSVVFDRQQGDVSLYESIHKEFRELVDTLIECFCADTNIPIERLREELKSANVEKLNIHQKTNLEPVAAAENFNVFVPMMMRKNVELQLQALQMIEFMCGLLPSVLQIEEGESFRNKARAISPEETERYVLIAVMRQSREEFDNLSKREMEELEEVLRSSEEERRRLEEERMKEQELVSKALAYPEGQISSSAEVSQTGTFSATVNEAAKHTASNVTSEEKPEAVRRNSSAETKPTRVPTAKKERRESVNDRPSSAKSLAVGEKERKDFVRAKSPSDRTSTEEGRPATKRSDGRPPTAKRTGSQAGERKKSASVKERRRSSVGSISCARSSTSFHPSKFRSESIRQLSGEAKKPADETNVGNKAATTDDVGVLQGPREKSVYDVNALLQEPSRLNTAAVRSREEYLRMQRDRLLAMKASEREKQMNEVSQRAAQERPRTAKAARGLMRGSRAGIDSEDVLAARRAIVEKLKSEIDGAPSA